MNPFCGHPTGELSCGNLRLEYLTDVGPRIVRLFAPQSEVSLLADVPGAVKVTPVGEYRFMGGHRLWHAPEALPRSYLPDEAVAVQLMPGGVRLSAPACKVGCDNPAGWIAYWLDGVLFVKRYRHEAGGRYPDRGRSTEVNCGDKFIEVESLGTLSWIEPGEQVVHEETWELYDDLNQSFIPASLRQRLEAT
jgi:hypothetical protein